MKTRNTKPEIKIRSILFSKGYRFILHDKRLPGKPDIVLPKHKVVINVNGCFWHHHGCGKCNIPRSKTNYWLDRFEINKQRDFINKKKLKKLGWKIIDIWECTLEPKKINNTFKNLELFISV